MSADDCTCEYGCPNCGYALAAMSNCPAWDPCPVGREPDPACPVHQEMDARGRFVKGGGR